MYEVSWIVLIKGGVGGLSGGGASGLGGSRGICWCARSSAVPGGVSSNDGDVVI